MDTDPRIMKLRKILKKQIKWYQKYKDDEELIYDELVNKFDDLKRGDYVDIIETILNNGDITWQ